MTFELIQKGTVKYLAIETFEKTNLVRHGFSTRTLDLSLKGNNDKQRVMRNYRLFCGAVGVDVDNLVASDQVHGDEIYKAIEKDRGKGILKDSDIKHKDALITCKKGVALVTYYADCVPLFFLDVKTPAIGLAHAGWRGTVKRIGQKTVSQMVEHFGTQTQNILAGIGPCIKKCCYEVDEPVVGEFQKAFNYWGDFVKSLENGHFMLDLLKANKSQLEEIGIKSSNVSVCDYCTSCRNDLFYSYRADKKKTGSLAAVLELI